MNKPKNKLLVAFSAFLLLFGLLTLFMGSSVLFDLFGIRELEGNYIPFVVVANVACAILYLFASVGLWKQKKWASVLLFVALAILIVTFIGIGIHIKNDGIYEVRTLKAMTFRTSITALLAIVSHFILRKSQ